MKMISQFSFSCYLDILSACFFCVSDKTHKRWTRYPKFGFQMRMRQSVAGSEQDQVERTLVQRNPGFNELANLGVAVDIWWARHCSTLQTRPVKPPLFNSSLPAQLHQLLLQPQGHNSTDLSGFQQEKALSEILIKSFQEQRHI